MSDNIQNRTYDRRTVLGIAGGASLTALAGCLDDIDNIVDEGTPLVTDGSGTFQLYISDQPVAIDEFESLVVDFDYARVFPSSDSQDGEDDDDQQTPDTGDNTDDIDESDGGAESEENNNAGDADEEEEEFEDAGDADDETREDGSDENGFFILDLDGQSVDLTDVLGDKAIRVWEGELDEGEYDKIELHIHSADGILKETGDSVDVKVPSEKLQIVHSFEVTAEETTGFVFDINVVAKGQTGGYNLLPVISESGVVGDDVDIEDVTPDE